MKLETTNKIIELTTEQEGILTGLMLGDGHLALYGRSKNAFLVVKRSRKDCAYIDEHVDMFNNMGAKRTDDEAFNPLRNKSYQSCSLRTSTQPILTEWHKRWYYNGKKMVPPDLKLTPLALAIWFADDGSIVIRKKPDGKGHIVVSLYTNGFSYPEVKFLKEELFNKFNINARIQETSYKRTDSKITKYWYLQLYGRFEIIKFINIIGPVFPKSMKRKSDRWENNMQFLPSVAYPNCKFCGSSEVRRRGFNSSNKQKYTCKSCKRTFI